MAEATLTFDGDLDIATVAAVHSRAMKAHRAGQLPESIDLAAVERVDSAGLALLLELQAWSRASGQTMRFTNPPDNLLVLAELSQADELLGWATEDNR